MSLIMLVIGILIGWSIPQPEWVKVMINRLMEFLKNKFK